MEGNLEGRGHLYTYGWFILLYSRNQYNIVKNYTPIKINFQKVWPHFIYKKKLEIVKNKHVQEVQIRVQNLKWGQFLKLETDEES